MGGKLFSWRPICIASRASKSFSAKIFNVGRGIQFVHEMEERNPPQVRKRWYAMGTNWEYYDPAPENTRHVFTSRSLSQSLAGTSSKPWFNNVRITRPTAMEKQSPVFRQLWSNTKVACISASRYFPPFFDGTADGRVTRWDLIKEIKNTV
jgi:hypothetical protein